MSFSENDIGNFGIYTAAFECAQDNKEHFIDIDVASDGDCLFESLIKLLSLQISCRELRTKLLNHPSLLTCGDPETARKILTAEKEFGTSECIYIFSRCFECNICVHLHKDNGDFEYCKFLYNDSSEFIHLYLRGVHFCPLWIISDVKGPGNIDEKAANEILKRNCLTARQEINEMKNDTSMQWDNPIITDDFSPIRNNSRSEDLQNLFHDNIISKNIQEPNDEHDLNNNNSLNKLIDYSDSEDEIENDIDAPLFTTVNILRDHPFRKPNHLVYFLSADGFRDTELIGALLDASISIC